MAKRERKIRDIADLAGQSEDMLLNGETFVRMPPRDRGRRNSNERGSAAARRRRRQWLLQPDSGFGGDGGTVPCHAPTPEGRICGVTVNLVTLVVGRIVPGYRGGTYKRSNIRPECAPCSTREGAGLTNAQRGANA